MKIVIGYHNFLSFSEYSTYRQNLEKYVQNQPIIKEEKLQKFMSALKRVQEVEKRSYGLKVMMKIVTAYRKPLGGKKKVPLVH